MKQLLHNSI